MVTGQNGHRHNAPRLTRKEEELLKLLEANPGRCFSRPYLLKTIWGYSNETRTRTVDVHISRLRKKLQDRRDLVIHTVVRQGYVLQRSAPRGTAAGPAVSLAASAGSDDRTYAVIG